ncbi:ataxin-2 homolog [Pistacia vera]|uniref:ataxin-2 homolog n=1 Tax=Pistacia vera TaxID=55513 RepID=UPI001263CA4D|nr:ataxin-2 homolog [Pistacia vera]
MSTSNPFSTTTTTTSTPPPPPPPTQQQQQQQQQQQHIYPNIRPSTTPNPNQGILYPVASSGRGFIQKPLRPNSNTSDHTVTVANHAPYPPRPNHLPHHHHLVRPPFTHQHHIPPIRGIPVSSPHPKVVPSSSPMVDSNGYKNSRDRKDETSAIIRDRKVRISEGASLYALCRSWLKNGFPEEIQPQYGDGVKSLPRPLPMPVDSNVAKKREGEEEEEEEEEKGDDKEEVAHLSEKELLKRHVKHAKKVRARLREERAKRIERYKTRLSLLLPPLVEQSRNDGAAGN